MQEKEIARERIHRDFLIRLCEGEFPLGSSIPSLPDLCAQYNVGKNTIVKVVQMLKEDGFVATSPGRVGQVLFDCDKLDDYMKDLPGFICDKNILADYYYAIRLLFPSILAYASLSCDKKELAQVKALIGCLHHDGAKTYIRLSINFFRAILSNVENQLLKKVAETTLQETMIPGVLLCGHNEIFGELMLQVTAVADHFYVILKQKDLEQLKVCWEQLLTLYQMILGKALILGIFPDIPNSHGINIFQHVSDDKRFIIAVSFRNKIVHGEYEEGDLLPSISEAKEIFKVSTITIRKAYDILGEMGFTQTVNGRGTHVIPFLPQKTSKFLEKAALDRKTGYLEAVAFLEITCETVVLAAKQITFAELRRDIESRWNPEHQYSVATIFYHLFKGIGSLAVFSIYEAITGYLYWGCYLKDIPAAGNLCKSNHQKCLEVIDALENQDFEAAINMMMKLLKSLYPVTE